MLVVAYSPFLVMTRHETYSNKPKVRHVIMAVNASNCSPEKCAKEIAAAGVLIARTKNRGVLFRQAKALSVNMRVVALRGARSVRSSRAPAPIILLSDIAFVMGCRAMMFAQYVRVLYSI